MSEFRLISCTENPVETLFAVWVQSRPTQFPAIHKWVALTGYSVVTALHIHELTSGEVAFNAEEEEWDGQCYDSAVREATQMNEVFTKVVAMDIPVSECIHFTWGFADLPIEWREQAVRKRQWGFWLTSMREFSMADFYTEGRWAPPVEGSVDDRMEAQLRAALHTCEVAYQELIADGCPQEIARKVIPLCATHNGSMFANMRALLATVASRSCFTAETRIPLLNGTEVAIGDMLPGEEVFTYTLDSEGSVVAGKAWSNGVTRRDAPVVKVTLDNGESFRCTRDHLIMRRDGSYVEAGDLEGGDSLMPLYRKFDEEGFWKAYEKVYNPSSDSFELTHHCVIQGNPSECSSSKYGWVRHHKDFDTRNNDPRNLEWMRWDAHKAFHEENCGRNFKWDDSEWRRQATERNRENGKRNGLAIALQRENLIDGSPILVDLNHTVVSVEDDGYEDVYDLSVDDHHNFAISAGVFVHNCWIAQLDLWGPVLEGIVQGLSEVDPLLGKIVSPPCLARYSEEFKGCKYNAINENRTTGKDPYACCPLWWYHNVDKNRPDEDKSVQLDKDWQSFLDECNTLEAYREQGQKLLGRWMRLWKRDPFAGEFIDTP